MDSKQIGILSIAGSLLKDLGNLFYPNNCIICHDGLARSEKVLCTACLYHIPRTRFWLTDDNPVAKIFWGRVRLEQACSFFYFARGSRYRKLLHLLKYRGRSEVGEYLGEVFGQELYKSELYSNIDGIVPVPLHPKKLRIRGYNQAEVIANGLSKAMGVPVINDVLIRNVFTQTQTRKNRADRVKNVSGAFSVINSESVEGCHLLLVDDVVTTGATLEVCAQALLQSTNAKVSVATLAYAYSI
ncbi:MAG TPA: ComF family protein [Tenuifilaceae bacterium]|nr:ComF family protein [Tenuifilaceae bacterium]